MAFLFQPIDNEGIKIYQSWFDDETTRRRISYPDTVWTNYVLNTPNVYCWRIWENADCVGVLQADIIESVAYFVLVMNPTFRGKGYCKFIINTFVQLPAMQHVEVFEAQIEKDNIVSLKCHAAAGFAQTGEDEAFFHLQRKEKIFAF